MANFIGRKDELKLLHNLLDKRSASVVVVFGRRRIGKSRLIEQFGKNLNMYFFIGLPPQPHMTMQTQLNEFSRYP